MIKRTPEQQQALEVIEKEVGDFRFYAASRILLSTNLSLVIEDGEVGLKTEHGFIPVLYLLPEDGEEREEIFKCLGVRENEG